MARRRSRSRLRGASVPDAVVLDSGALSAGASGQVRVRAELAIAEQLGVRVHVSSVVLAEVLRGHPRDARVHALLQALAKDAVTPELGRAAGEVLGRAGGDDTIDAIVAVSAESLSGRVRLLAGDVSDLRRLTADMPNVSVAPI